MPNGRRANAVPLALGLPFSDHLIVRRAFLFLAAAGGRNEAEVEIARFERFFVVA